MTPTPPPTPRVSGAPPDPDRRWTATIAWRHADAKSRFCVFAQAVQGEPATVLAESTPLEWPPTSAASVQALRDAAEDLENELVAAGWTTLPRGSEWYAKRFAWEPASAEAVDAPATRPDSGDPPGRFDVVSTEAGRGRWDVA